MKKTLRLVLFILVAVGLSSLGGATPAFARHHHHKHVTHHRKAKTGHSVSSMTYDAQLNLIRLGYMEGKPDGILGPKTKKAIMAFQRDHGLPVTGALDSRTYDALMKAEGGPQTVAALPVPFGSTSAAHPEIVGETNFQYADPLLGGPVVAGGKDEPQEVRTQGFLSRFTKLDVSENANGPVRRYNVTVKGSPILLIDNQPSIIGISKTYELPNEDAIIFTTYHEGDKVCAYKYYLLSLAEGSSELFPIANCSHGYQARVVNDSLFINFPEIDDQRVAGATWRYEGRDLERL